MWWHFFTDFTISKYIEHREYISCFTMHVELFLQLQAHVIKGKLPPPPPPWKRVILILTPLPPSWLYLYLMSPPPPHLGLVFQPPLLIVIAQSLIKCSETAGEVNRDGLGQKHITPNSGLYASDLGWLCFFKNTLIYANFRHLLTWRIIILWSKAADHKRRGLGSRKHGSWEKLDSQWLFHSLELVFSLLEVCCLMLMRTFHLSLPLAWVSGLP